MYSTSGADVDFLFENRPAAVLLLKEAEDGREFAGHLFVEFVSDHFVARCVLESRIQFESVERISNERCIFVFC